jgi:ferredoxin
LKILADRHVCIGAGMCALTAPAVFDQDSDAGLVLVLDETPNGAAEVAAREAISLCPSGALTALDN